MTSKGSLCRGHSKGFHKQTLIIKAPMNRPEGLLKECQLRCGIGGLVCPESAFTHETKVIWQFTKEI
jgi:hypothetical protein